MTVLRFASLVGPRIDTVVTRYFALPVVPTVLGYDARLQLLHEEDALAVLERAVGARPAGRVQRRRGRRALLSQAIRRAGRVPLPVPPARRRDRRAGARRRPDRVVLPGAAAAARLRTGRRHHPAAHRVRLHPALDHRPGLRRLRARPRAAPAGRARAGRGRRVGWSTAACTPPRGCSPGGAGMIGGRSTTRAPGRAARRSSPCTPATRAPARPARTPPAGPRRATRRPGPAPVIPLHAEPNGTGATPGRPVPRRPRSARTGRDRRRPRATVGRGRPDRPPTGARRPPEPAAPRRPGLGGSPSGRPRSRTRSRSCAGG